MHSLGRVLLPHAGLRVVFDAAVMLHFVSILLSYGIGGSEAYAQALGVPYTYVIPFFVIFWSLFILIGYEFIHKVISVFTFAKGSLLAVIVLITAIVAYYAQQPSHSDWVYVGQPLLVGTVALGGGMNLLPVVYGKLTAFSRRDMVWLCWSCVLAITGVYVLNVMWCYYILVRGCVSPECSPSRSLTCACARRKWFRRRASRCRWSSRRRRGRSQRCR